MSCEHEHIPGHGPTCLPHLDHMMEFIIPWMKRQKKQKTMRQAVRAYLNRNPLKAPGVIEELIAGMVTHG